MSKLQILWALICVLAISGGQLLFKQAGIEIQQAGTWFSTRVVVYVGLAGIVYGLTTLLWINLLRYVPLNKAYLFMALCFVIVPIVGSLMFKESVSVGYVIGALLIISGLFVATIFG
jgi:drug/metabolite transporter (DMT)-like permease